jgi:hypothetical protein
MNMASPWPAVAAFAHQSRASPSGDTDDDEGGVEFPVGQGGGG